MDKNKAQVDFQPIGKRIEVEQGVDLLEAAQSAGVELVSICGGVGVCDSCKVRLMAGELSPPTLVEEEIFDADELEAGYRLGCQARVLSDVKIDVPPESLTTPQRLQVEGQEIEIEIDPFLKALEVQIKAPDLHDLRADSARLREAIAAAGYPEAHLELGTLKELSHDLRALNWSARLAMRASEMVAILPPATPLLGLAVDIGTTKVAGYLVDLESGLTLAKAGAMNPQIGYGEDVIARIAYVIERPQGRRTLQAKLVETLNAMLESLAMEAGVESKQVVEAVIVGNTAMHHLFAGLPVKQLGLAPYVPAVSEALDIPARDLGLNMAAGAHVHLPPNIAGYVGADHVSMVLATDLWQSDQTLIALDIGTNTEISLTVGGKLLSCSCASGPAFEGAHIHDGMRAAPGAIERVMIRDDGLRTYTIGGQAAVGVCGSGILDVVSEMRKAGIIDHRGAFAKEDPRVNRQDGADHFVLATTAQSGHGKAVVVNRSDINEIQLAKGAIRAGIEILLEEGGVELDDLDGFLVAGAFGTYLDIDSAVGIGMFPDLPREKFQQVGNAAGAGAKQMLVSAARRQAAAEIARRSHYIELTTHDGFRDRFMAALYL